MGESLGPRQRGWGEHIEGTDLHTLDARDLKALRLADTAAVSAKTRSGLALTESGVHLVMAKTQKPAGRAFRRFLVDTVLPTFRAQLAPQDPPQDAEALAKARAILCAQSVMMLQRAPWPVLVEVHQLCQAQTGLVPTG